MVSILELPIFGHKPNQKILHSTLTGSTHCRKMTCAEATACISTSVACCAVRICQMGISKKIRRVGGRCAAPEPQIAKCRRRRLAVAEVELREGASS